jgi:hypothetical protein
MPRGLRGEFDADTVGDGHPVARDRLNAILQLYRHF